jgi:uncharacterized protein
MKAFVSNKIGRIFFIRMEEGDLVAESINEFIKDNKVVNGVVVSAIGTLSTGVTHYITTTGYPSSFTFDRLENKPIELSSIDGLIVDGVAHLHTVISDPERVYSGHLEPDCKVLYVFEMAIIEVMDLEITRKPNEKGKSQIEYK